MQPTLEAWQPPAGALRNAELEAWEVSERDASGTKDGAAALYRDDGSLLLRFRYAAGKRSGPFTSYHPNGDVESEGIYVEGALDGSFVRYTSDRPGSTPLRDCCVPPGARTLRATYRRGASLGELFYDGGGRALRSDGLPLPERASGVPDEAMFEESEERWVHRLASENDTLLRRSFELDGRLVEEVEIAGARRVALREFQRSGALAREHRFDDAGALHGPCLLRYGDGDVPYADRAIREVRGAFEHGQAVGAWRFFDAAGRELRTDERGEPLSEARFAELFAKEAPHENAEALFARAEALLAERRVREALFFAALGAARAGSAARFSELLARSVAPLHAEAAARAAAALDGEESPSVRGVFDALLAGGDAPALLRLLGTLIPPVRPEARELVEAALLLAPANGRMLLTRALIRLEQGDVDGALADVAELGDEFGGAAAQIRELARVLFPAFVFSPAREPLPEPNPELQPIAVEQPLEAVRRTIVLYGARLAAIRAELRRRLGGAEPAWLPPDASFLVEAEPVELRRFTAAITDEEEDGSETSEVRVDETLALGGASAATLMIVARADFDALSWLCWSAGLDEIALPRALTPRPGFPAAVNLAMLRCFRTHDQLRTAGLVSRSREIPSFTWEELPVETLSSRLAEIAAHQYLERRAMFFFLLFPQNLSPFQSDLRQV